MRNSKNDDRSVRGYAKDLSKVIILDVKKEREYFAKYKKTGDIESRNKLVESGLRFVIKIAQAYARDLDHHKQLISAGNEGLLVAVDRFDPNRGTRFLSYATWWVTLYIREELHRQSVVTIPMWRKKSLRKVREARQNSWDKKGRPPTDREMQRRTGLSRQQLKGLEQETYETVPLDAGAMSVDNGMNIEKTFINESGDRLVQYLISSLPLREAFIIRAYGSFLTPEPMSLKQIAGILGISSERIRQIKSSALESMRVYLEKIGINSTSDVYSNEGD